MSNKTYKYRTLAFLGNIPEEQDEVNIDIFSILIIYSNKELIRLKELIIIEELNSDWLTS